jgi:DNA invertase Pin-like site-specific DNA recombinase
MNQYISYRRASTRRQGRSGLGLEAQQTAVAEFVRREGGKLLADYVEVESGRKCDRPELAKALSHTKMAKATLIVARLDRLARNVKFLAVLMESGVQFTCVDCPHFNPFVIHVLSAVAEHEAALISQRTSAALQSVKRRGKLLGAARPGWAEKHGDARLRGAASGGKAAAPVNRRKAIEAYGHLYQKLAEMRASGMSLRGIAWLLNTEGQLTRRGRHWTHKQVAAVLRRAATIPEQRRFLGLPGG